MSKDAAGSMMPYARNNIPRPKAVGDTLAYLRAWQEVFHGDSFVFDYHYMWDHFKDPGYYSIAKVLHDDIENLKGIGLNGYVSCQNQRVFMPNGLGMHMMGSVLWSGGSDFDSEAVKYFKAAYGSDWRKCRDFLKKMSVKFDPPALRGEKPAMDGAAAGKIAKRYLGIAADIDDFIPVIKRNLDPGADGKVESGAKTGDICQMRSWEYMAFYAEVLRKLSVVLAARAAGDAEGMNMRWLDVRDYVCLNEYRFQRVFDVSLFINTWRKILK